MLQADASCAPHREPAPVVYAALPDYEHLVDALNRRRLECDVSFRSLAETASLQPGFVSGALGPSRTRRFGWLSVFLLLPPLGLRIALVEAPELAALYADSLTKRNANQARPSNFASRVGTRQISRVLKYLAKRGGEARMRKMMPEELREHQRRAALARRKIRYAALANIGQGKERA
jgi:hypothetical protein